MVQNFFLCSCRRKYGFGITWVWVKWWQIFLTEENTVEQTRYFGCFFAHKRYSCHFIKLRLNHCSHMDYFNHIFTTFLGLESGNNVAVYGGVRKLLDLIKISSFVVWRWKVFGTSWGWVINDWNLIFGWTNPLTSIQQAKPVYLLKA